MAVGFDAATESNTGTTGFLGTPDPFTYSHTPSGTPRGVLLYCIANGTGAGVFVGATYGGVTMTEVGWTQDNAGEVGQTKAYFLGASIPTGTQTVSIDHSGSATEKYAVVITVTANTDTEAYVAGIVTEAGDITLAQRNVDDGSPGTNSMRFAGLMGGFSSVPTAGAQSTAVHSIDYGQRIAAVARETQASQGSQPVGWTTGGADDVAAVYVPVREVAVVDRQGGMVRATTALQAVQRAATWMRRHDGLLVPERRIWRPA